MRDDLFTHIHKGLRLGLFELTISAGATDWTDPSEVAALEAQWRPLLNFLHSHTRHEDDHILRVLSETRWVIGGPSGAAARLGMNRTTLNHRMRKLGITRPQPQPS